MTDRFESILDESISALQAGVPIEEILAEVPEYAAELRPLLYAATVLADPDPELIPEERKSVLRDEYMKQVAELPAIPTPSLGQKTHAIWNIMRKRLSREAVLNDLITVVITVTLTLFMAIFILNYLAIDSVPGDFLYGIKRASENIQLSLTFSETHRAELLTDFNRRRLAEIEQLMAQKRVAVVQFSEILETKGKNLWIVGGYSVFLPPDLAVAESVQEGDLIEVIGLLRTNNVVVADSIRVLE